MIYLPFYSSQHVHTLKKKKKLHTSNIMCYSKVFRISIVYPKQWTSNFQQWTESSEIHWECCIKDSFEENVRNQVLG